MDSITGTYGKKWDMRHTQLKVWASPEVVEAFKAKCRREKVSMASELTRFMCGRCSQSTPNKAEKFGTATRQQRRKSLQALIPIIEAILAAEEQYMEAIPANLQNSIRYEAAAQTVSALEDSLENLGEAYS